MAQLRSCNSCAGFLAPASTTCPHCGHTAQTLPKGHGHGVAGKLLGAACSGAVALTMMACYGGPPMHRPPCPDHDGDGYVAKSCPTKEPVDCDDSDPAVHPGAEDPDGDGIDQNCDGADGSAGVVRGESPAPGSAVKVGADAEAATGGGGESSTTAATSAGDAAAGDTPAPPPAAAGPATAPPPAGE